MTQSFRYFVEAIEDHGHDGGYHTVSVVCELPHELTYDDHDIIEDLVGSSIKKNATPEHYDLSIIPLEEAIIKISKNKTIPYICISFDNGSYLIQNKNISLTLRNNENISKEFNVTLEESNYRDFASPENSAEYWTFSFRKTENLENNWEILHDGQFEGDLDAVVGFTTKDNYVRVHSGFIPEKGSFRILYYPENKKYIVINNILNELHVIDENTSKLEKNLKIKKP